LRETIIDILERRLKEQTSTKIVVL
jgi:hypothetical protein